MPSVCSTLARDSYYTAFRDDRIANPDRYFPVMEKLPSGKVRVSGLAFHELTTVKLYDTIDARRRKKQKRA